MAVRRTLALLIYALFANAQREINSTFFGPCSKNSSLTASEFNVSIFDNGTVAIQLNGTSTYTGNDTLSFVLLEASEQIYQTTVDPCSFYSDIGDIFCPANAGRVYIPSDISATNLTIPSQDIADDLFTSPDLNAEFRFYLNGNATSEPVGCLKATLSNGVRGDTGMGNMTQSNGTNETNSSSSSSSNSSGMSGGDKGGSNAGTAYLNWALLMHVTSCLNSIEAVLTCLV